MADTSQLKKFDLILFGATGFTGQLVAEYIHDTYRSQGELHWAMAGRDIDKLRSIQHRLNTQNIPLIVADAKDVNSLHEMCAQTKVVCTTVGPYSKYGTSVVRACVENNTHYCDLSGEVPWMRQMIDQFHEEAQQRKLRIIHSCGFDSIPSDMGVFFLQKKALAIKNEYCKEVKTGVKAAKGGLSGGTFESFKEVLDRANKDKSIYKILQDPYSLNPAHERPNGRNEDVQSIAYDKDFESWKSPFIMASINTRIVRRGIALRNHPYGRDFSYDEFTLTGKGLKGRLRALMQSVFLLIIVKSKSYGWLEKLIDHFTPDPGEGPSREERENGFWVFDLIGKWEDEQYIKVRIKGDRDPGYGSTSKMLAESAVCLAKDQLPSNYGILSPSAAMGDELLERLQTRAGVSFEVKNFKTT